MNLCMPSQCIHRVQVMCTRDIVCGRTRGLCTIHATPVHHYHNRAQSLLHSLTHQAYNCSGLQPSSGVAGLDAIEAGAEGV